MTDEQYVRAFGEAYSLLMSVRKDEDFVINPEQAKKFGLIVDFFTKSAKKLGGEVKPIKLIPHEQNGDLEAYFEVFSLNGPESVQEFCRVIKHASAFGIDPTDDGRVCIGITVPNIFIHK